MEKSKLIKLSDSHYIIVDDSEIKETGVYGYHFILKRIDLIQSLGIDNEYCKRYKKITHSTKPLEFIKCNVCNDSGCSYSNGDMSTPCSKCNGGTKKDYINVKPLTLSEVEELTLGYSVEKMAENYKNKKGSIPTTKLEDEIFKLAYKDGFKAHQALVKDKLVTVEEMRKELVTLALEIATEDGQLNSCSPSLIYSWIENKIQSLPSTAEWVVTFDENGKLQLI
jgi:hypothetical protein